MKSVTILESPGAKAFGSGLGFHISSALMSLRQILAKAGRIDEALKYARIDGLNSDLDPRQPRTVELSAIENERTADLFRAAGRTAEAIEQAARAVDSYRKLDAESPGQYLPRLASALNMLALAQADGRRYSDQMRLTPRLK